MMMIMTMIANYIDDDDGLKMWFERIKNGFWHSSVLSGRLLALGNILWR